MIVTVGFAVFLFTSLGRSSGCPPGCSMQVCVATHSDVKLWSHTANRQSRLMSGPAPQRPYGRLGGVGWAGGR